MSVHDKLLEQSIEEHAELWQRMADAVSCGQCGKTTAFDSGYQCRCGRILCPECGERWGWCKDHAPVCLHPELVPTRWDQKWPGPTTMIGHSKYNMTCPICGFGWGCHPDPWDLQNNNTRGEISA